MWPGSSVSGLYLAHPESHYFGVAKVERDQVEDYAARKGMAVAEAERWLAPILNYVPDALSEAAEVATCFESVRLRLGRRARFPRGHAAIDRRHADGIAVPQPERRVEIDRRIDVPRNDPGPVAYSQWRRAG